MKSWFKAFFLLIIGISLSSCGIFKKGCDCPSFSDKVAGTAISSKK